MNYCPAGSLHDAIPATPEPPAAKKGRKGKAQSQGVYNDRSDVPEPLLWKWFEDLAKSCLLLEQGKDHTDDLTDRRSGHHVIVHRDIKPANLFLDRPSGNHGDWPDYPIATLGDFG